jgi:transposase-like protein
VRLLLDNHEKESLIVYTDGFRAYDPLDDDESFHRKAVIHGDDEHVIETHTSPARRWLSLNQGVSKDKLIAYLKPF